MSGFSPPPYPHDRLHALRERADQHDGGMVDLSIGTPCDPPPDAVIEAMATSGTERGYPPSAGTVAYRAAAAEWLGRRFDVDISSDAVAACVGTKEMVAGIPQWLHLRSPERDTVLYPAVSYPTYAMGATLAGCRAVPVAVDDQWRIDVGTIDPSDAARAVCLWVNTPGNPAGGLDDLGSAAAWGRAHGVPVLSDECYAEFTWAGEARTILEFGNEGVLALHSLSKRSNLAGLRAGFYAGDQELVDYLRVVRQHAGFLVAGPVQAAAVVAYSDQAHVDEQRARYRRRLERLREIVAAVGTPAPFPGGAFYLWIEAPDGDEWALADLLADRCGIVGSPGEFYGEAGRGHLRLAAVAPDDRLELAAARVGV